MKLVYLGSGDIGLPTLRALLASRHELLAVVTQPDRPVGRHQILTAGPIKALALAADIPVLQPERIRRPEAVEAMRALGADVFVVFAYGQILPKSVLDAPRVACLNLHASLLPRHRGAAPIQAAILAGDAESGLTVMYMDEGLDTGDALLERRFPLAPDETGGSLHDRLAELAPGALAEALDALAAGTAPRRPQDPALATHAPKLGRQSGRIDWTRDAVSLARLVRAMNPWPGAFTTLPVDGRALGLKIHDAVADAAPGTGHTRRGFCGQTRRVSSSPPGAADCCCANCNWKAADDCPRASFCAGCLCLPGTRLGA